MTVQSFTGAVTNADYDTIDNITGLSLTAGTTYSIQFQNAGMFKVGNAEFKFVNKDFIFKQGTDDAYVKHIGALPTILVIYENEQ